ncbi:MAG: CRTAC1 family protein, partial [Chloroflexi bacterium]|nr:CRTAC1 family protein [Chloroflexota bacterium]
CALALLAAACGGDGAPSSRAPAFADVTREAGISLVQVRAESRARCALKDDVCDGVMTGGAAAGDFDGDGWIDLYVTRNDAPGILYRNRGNGTFEDVTARAALDHAIRANGAAWGDVDNDGDLDLYVTTFGGERFHLYINDGRGRFTEEAVSRGAALAGDGVHMGFSVAFGDFDRDGWLDIYTTEWRPRELASASGHSHARLLRNLGAAKPGFFEDVTEAAGVALEGIARDGVWSFAGMFTDLDDDGWPDLAVTADWGNSRLFWNERGRFVDGTKAAGVGGDENGMGSAVGDFDGDGRLDWFVTSIFATGERCADCPWGMSGNRLYRNEGGRRFSDATDAMRVRDGDFGWGAALFDCDNDGDLDIVMTNGLDMRFGPGDVSELAERHLLRFRSDRMRFWRNDGSVMTEIAESLGITDRGSGKGLLVFDYDNDGDLDLFVVNHGGEPKLYRNDGGNANGWLRVRLESKDAGRVGVGAKVTVRVTKDGPVQVREIHAGGEFLGQSEAVAHFGLGPGKGRVAEVRVRWPTTGTEQVLRNVERSRVLVVRE